MGLTLITRFPFDELETQGTCEHRLWVVGQGELRDCDEDCLPKRWADWESEGCEYGLRDDRSGSSASCGLRC